MNTVQHEIIFEDILKQVQLDYPDLDLISQVSIASQRFWTGDYNQFPSFFSLMKSSTILKELLELKKTWRNQGFKYTEGQKTKYQELIQLRRELVTYWKKNGMAWVGPKIDKKEKQQEIKDAQI